MFYFNPVVSHGAYNTEGEPLKASDLLLHPEIVIGRHRGNGRLAIMKHLTALWMEPPPDRLVAGFTDQDDVFDILLNYFLDDVLEYDQHPFMKELLLWLCSGEEDDRLGALALTRQIHGDPLSDTLTNALETKDRTCVCTIVGVYPSWRRFRDWKNEQNAFIHRQASLLESLVKEPCRFPILVTDNPDRPMIPWESVRTFLDNRFENDPEARRLMLDALSIEIAGRYRAGEFPAQDGTRLYLGRLITSNGESIPLDEAELVLPGAKAYSDFSIHPVCPILIFSSDALPQLALQFIHFEQSSSPKSARERAYGAYFEMLGALLRDDEFLMLCEALGRENADCVPLAYSARKRRRKSHENDAADASMVFRLLFHDARSDRLPLGHPALSRAIAQLNLTGFSRESLEELKREITYWSSSENRDGNLGSSLFS